MSIKTIGVVGMGYVGIPAAVLFADAPCYDKVYGFQRNSESSGYKIDMLNKGVNPLKGEEPLLDDLLKKVVSENKFECTPNFSKIAECDAVTISIQTPFLNKTNLTPDFFALSDGLKNVGTYLSKDTLVVLESTVTPGTTEGYACDILESYSRLFAGADFYLAHAPERVMVGRLIDNIRNHDRIIGGIDERSTKEAIELYTPILVNGKVIPMTAIAAEATKTSENAYRDLQIAASNQLALYCESMGINFYDVKKGIDSLKGEGVTRAMLLPGAGVGGHCLTKDTYHLERGARKNFVDYPSNTQSLYLTARKINDFMPTHMFNLLMDAVDRLKLEEIRVVILGWSFLPNTNDCRETPSESFEELLIDHSIDYIVHDPYMRMFDGDVYEDIENRDAVVIFTAHNEYKNLLNPTKVKSIMRKEHPIIVDGRNIINPDEYIEQGFIYKGIGRGDKNNHRIKVCVE